MATGLGPRVRVDLEVAMNERGTCYTGDTVRGSSRGLDLYKSTRIHRRFTNLPIKENSQLIIYNPYIIDMMTVNNRIPVQ